jgi:hypothetical protein
VYELEELIERHVEFYDPKTDRPVRLPSVFVRHYLKRDDGALPIVTSIAQLPIVLPDGTVLTGEGVDRRSGIYFDVPKELVLPKREDLSEEAVREAMAFLTDEWLCDVAADYPGKLVAVACALTIIEKSLLPQRPAFFVTGGRRGAGKTTLLRMIAMAATGLPAAAAAWSTSEEERRKALFSYLGAGLAFLIWDNIARGTTITCTSIERSLTEEFYSDRVLGFSEVRTVPTYTVQAFTGNNVGPRGDLASRSLVVRLSADQLDPENRSFKHPDPVGWTNVNRGKILRSMYAVLLGNPRRAAKRKGLAAPPTRFKEWWEMVGSAVEFAAREEIDFKKIFAESEADEEADSSLTFVLRELSQLWPNGFTSADVAAFLQSRAEDGDRTLLVALEDAAGKAMRVVSPHVVSWRLKAIKDNPVEVEEGALLVLRWRPGTHGGTFAVERIVRQQDLTGV